MIRLLAGAGVFTAAMGISLYANAATAPEPEEPRGVVKVRLLGVNDFHGHLDPPRPGVGGAAWLKAHLDRAGVPGRTIRVHAGDMVGASPLVSSWFHDEPSIEAANEIGFDVGTVGNHEFDEGGAELMRLLRGGRRTGPAAFRRDADGGFANTSSPDFAGARFPYIAANTLTTGGEQLLPPFEIVERAGARIGFIGVTTPSTPKFMLARHAREYRFTDMSDAVNRWVPALRARGIEAIVVLAHAGAPTQDESDAPALVGEIVDEAREMSAAVDVVIAGHSHSRLDFRVPNPSGQGDKLVVEALSYGVAYDLVDMTVDTRTGDVVAKSGRIVPTSHADALADVELSDLVARYRVRVAPLADKVVGASEAGLTRSDGTLGQMTADAQHGFAGTDAAVVEPGALRADIAPGPITYAEVAEALAYDHRLVRFELTGRELRSLGERGAYVAAPRPLEPDTVYSVAASEMLAPHGRQVGTEVEALAWYLDRRRAAR